jgi:hypothetical protein
VLIPYRAVDLARGEIKVMYEDGRLEVRRVNRGLTYEGFLAVEGLKPSEWFVLNASDANNYQGDPLPPRPYGGVGAVPSLKPITPDRVTLSFPTETDPKAVPGDASPRQR